MDPSRVSPGFSKRIRVLVVDNDSASLIALEKKLKKCKYEVTSTSSAEEALKMIGEARKDWFDIVLCDGFDFVQHVRKQLADLPVIMMSRDGEESNVMRSVALGACDYLVKPLRLKDVKNIWQHVYRKQLTTHPQQQHSLDDELNESSQQTGNRRSRETEFESGAESSSIKKPRLSWTDELKNKFVQVVNQIGVDKATPKNILELMGDASLTRENIASHLQKYRLNASRTASKSGGDTNNSSVKMAQSSVSSRQQNIVFPNIRIHSQHQPAYTFSSQLPHRFIQYDQCWPCTYTLPQIQPSNAPPPIQHMVNNTPPPPPPPPPPHMGHQQLVYNPQIPSFSDFDELNQGLAMEDFNQGLDNIGLDDIGLDNSDCYCLGDILDPYTTNQQQQHGVPPDHRFDFPYTTNEAQHVPPLVSPESVFPYTTNQLQHVGSVSTDSENLVDS